MDESAEHIKTLIHQARQKATSVDELLEKYRNYLLLLARGWVDTQLQAKADASDVVQETFMKAYQGFDQFRGHTDAELAAWLRQILARNLTDLARKYKNTQARDTARERALEDQLGHSSRVLGDLVQAAGNTPSEAARGREMAVILADALAELEEDQCEIVILRGLFQLSWDEVADRMGRTAGAVRMVWTRALARLKPLIETRL